MKWKYKKIYRNSKYLIPHLNTILARKPLHEILPLNPSSVTVKYEQQKFQSTCIVYCLLYSMNSTDRKLWHITRRICVSLWSFWSLLPCCLARRTSRARDWSSQNTAQTFLNFSPSVSVNCHNHKTPIIKIRFLLGAEWLSARYHIWMSSA